MLRLPATHAAVPAFPPPPPAPMPACRLVYGWVACGVGRPRRFALSLPICTGMGGRREGYGRHARGVAHEKSAWDATSACVNARVVDECRQRCMSEVRCRHPSYGGSGCEILHMLMRGARST